MRPRTIRLLAIAFAVALHAGCASYRALLPAPPSEISKAIRPEPARLPAPPVSAVAAPPAGVDFGKIYRDAVERTRESMSRGEARKAIPYWQALEDSPFAADALFNQGVLLQLSGDIDAAEAQYRRAAAPPFLSEPAAANLLGIGILRGNPELLRNLVDNVVGPVAALPGDRLPAFSSNLAAAYSELGRLGKAEEMFEAMRMSRSSTPAMPWNRAVLAYRNGNPMKAKLISSSLPSPVAGLLPVVASSVAWNRELTKAPAFDGKAFPDPRFELLSQNLASYVSWGKGDLGAAETHLSGVLADPHPRGEYLNNLGLVLAESGRWKDAKKLLERAVAEAPSLPEGWSNLGLYRENLSRGRPGSDPMLRKVCYIEGPKKGRGFQVVRMADKIVLVAMICLFGGTTAVAGSAPAPRAPKTAPAKSPSPASRSGKETVRLDEVKIRAARNTPGCSSSSPDPVSPAAPADGHGGDGIVSPGGREEGACRSVNFDVRPDGIILLQEQRGPRFLRIAVALSILLHVLLLMTSPSGNLPSRRGIRSYRSTSPRCRRRSCRGSPKRPSVPPEAVAGAPAAPRAHRSGTGPLPGVGRGGAGGDPGEGRDPRVTEDARRQGRGGSAPRNAIPGNIRPASPRAKPAPGDFSPRYAAEGGRSKNPGIERELATTARANREMTPRIFKTDTGLEVEIAGGGEEPSRSFQSIAGAVKEHQGGIRYAYNRELLANPNLSGKMIVSFVIRPDGAVESVEIRQSTLNWPPLETAVKKRMEHWKFPRIAGGSCGWCFHSCSIPRCDRACTEPPPSHCSSPSSPRGRRLPPPGETAGSKGEGNRPLRTGSPGSSGSCGNGTSAPCRS